MSDDVNVGMGRPMGLEQLFEGLRGATNRPGDQWAPKGTGDQRLLELEAHDHEINTGPCPFKVGDIVTPKRDTIERGHGIPHKVVEVLNHTRYMPEGPGKRISPENMASAIVIDGDLLIFAHHSDNMELFDKDKVYETRD